MKIRKYIFFASLVMVHVMHSMDQPPTGRRFVFFPTDRAQQLARSARSICQFLGNYLNEVLLNNPRRSEITKLLNHGADPRLALLIPIWQHCQIDGRLSISGVFTDATFVQALLLLEQNSPTYNELARRIFFLTDSGEVINFFIQNHFDINTHITPQGFTLLHLAAASGRLPLVRLLIERHAHINENSCGHTPLDIALAARQTDVTRFLIDHGARRTVELEHQPFAEDGSSSAARPLSPPEGMRYRELRDLVENAVDTYRIFLYNPRMARSLVLDLQQRLLNSSTRPSVHGGNASPAARSPRFSQDVQNFIGTISEWAGGLIPTVRPTYTAYQAASTTTLLSAQQRLLENAITQTYFDYVQARVPLVPTQPPQEPALQSRTSLDPRTRNQYLTLIRPHRITLGESNIHRGTQGNPFLHPMPEMARGVNPRMPARSTLHERSTAAQSHGLPGANTNPQHQSLRPVASLTALITAYLVKNPGVLERLSRYIPMLPQELREPLALMQRVMALRQARGLVGPGILRSSLMTDPRTIDTLLYLGNPNTNRALLDILLHHATKNHNDSAVRVILNYHATPHALFQGETALHVAATAGNTEGAQLLLERRAPLNICNARGMTPLDCALPRGEDHGIVMLLRSHGALSSEKKKLDKETKKNCEQLMRLAASTGNLSMVRLCIERGADINAQDEITGNTALMIAARNGYWQMVDFLLERNARKDIENRRGQTAYAMMTTHGLETREAQMRRETQHRRTLQVPSQIRGIEEMRMLLDPELEQLQHQFFRSFHTHVHQTGRAPTRRTVVVVDQETYYALTNLGARAEQVGQAHPPHAHNRQVGAQHGGRQNRSLMLFNTAGAYEAVVRELVRRNPLLLHQMPEDGAPEQPTNSSVARGHIRRMTPFVFGSSESFQQRTTFIPQPDAPPVERYPPEDANVSPPEGPQNQRRSVIPAAASEIAPTGELTDLLAHAESLRRVGDTEYSFSEMMDLLDNDIDAARSQEPDQHPLPFPFNPDALGRALFGNQWPK